MTLSKYAIPFLAVSVTDIKNRCGNTLLMRLMTNCSKLMHSFYLILLYFCFVYCTCTVFYFCCSFSVVNNDDNKDDDDSNNNNNN